MSSYAEGVRIGVGFEMQRAPAILDGKMEWSLQYGSRKCSRCGNCFRIPGVHYLGFKDCAPQCPPPRSYDVIGLDCWPAKAKEGDSGDDVSEEVSSSSGSEEVQGG